MNRFSIYLTIFFVFTFCITTVEYIMFRRSSKHKKSGSTIFGYTSLCACLTNVFYILSIISENYFFTSLMSSLYFLATDYLLISLMGFVFLIDKPKLTKNERIITKISHFVAMYETIIFVINPFKEIAVSFSKTNQTLPVYSYSMHPLCHLHILFTYVLLIAAFVSLVLKSLKVPGEYKLPYVYNIIGVVAVLVINFVFLFLDGDSFVQQFDVSANIYGIVIFTFYWSYYKYSSHGMLNKLKTSIFENIDKGLVLFDYNEFLILRNQKADALIGIEKFQDEVSIDEFSESIGVTLKKSSKSNYSFQCYLEKNNETKPVRCDYKRLKNEKNDLLGHLFMFSDIALETDILTGFHNWESFKVFALKNPDQFNASLAVAILDINALSVINSSFGRNEGDKMIRELSELMRKHFSDDVYFIREHEAHLVAICRNCDEHSMRSCVENIQQEFSGRIQYALNISDEGEHDIVEVIREASKAMKTKKLLDDSSSHSELISTLVKALEECDNDTEQHVQRTREMGIKLGKRIGLNDIQLSNLSLLCLLHDIGKIGIPLEILNKPGKLNEDEWHIMRSHAEKGYQIASSAKELEPIADMIKHHHERWDGMGYPDGLSKESIPILSRVISVIDSYDAMVNDRVYRSALSVQEAVGELKKCAGGQFDPHIVTEFISMINEEPVAKENKKYTKNKKYEDSEDKIKNNTVFPVMHSRYILDDENEIIEVDDLFENFTGYSRDDIAKNHMNQVDLIPENDRSLYMIEVTNHLQKSNLVFFEHHLKKKNGDVILVLCLGEVLTNKETGKKYTTVTISNIMHTQAVKTILLSEQDKAQKRLRQWENQYRSDSLTGLMNRSAFESDVEAKMLTESYKIMMIMIDFDKFKEYNDTFGHSKGDEYLIIAAHTLTSLIRDGDLACRMGGDEFALALFFRKEGDDESIYSRATTIFQDLSLMMNSNENIKFSGVSMGAAISSDEIRSFNQLYEAADKCLYEAKEKGRNRICLNNKK